nr:cytochrome P450 84A1-like [Ipomoea batatas]
MDLMSHYSHRGLAKLAEQYGGLLHLKMGSVHMVVVSGREEARQVLQVQDKVFANRPATIAIRYLTYDRADMAFAHYGPFWRQMRKVYVMKLFSRRRAESWDSVRDEVEKMVRAVAAGSAVNICELVNGLARDITYRVAFGSSLDEGKDEFVNIIRQFSDLFGAFNIADFFPWLKWADPHGLNPRLAAARASLDVFIDNVIENHMQKRKDKNEGISGEGAMDMVDQLLEFYSEEAAVNESEDLQNAIKLTRDNIKAVIMDVMFGGTNTIATAIEWAFAELMKSPENLKRVQKELAAVCPDRKVEQADLENLTFLKCCLKETLRLHAPIPLLLHETVKATEVNGYYIPAKSRVVINTWAIGRDKNYWEDDPESFKPERFLKAGAPDLMGNNFEFLPFGSGRRSCPGLQLGVYALEMAVANLLQCFTWELPNGMKPSEIQMEDAFGLKVSLANPLLLVPTPRLLQNNLH